MASIRSFFAVISPATPQETLTTAWQRAQFHVTLFCRSINTSQNLANSSDFMVSDETEVQEE